MFDTIQEYIFDTNIEPFFGRRARRRRRRKIRRAKKKAKELGDSMESNKINQSEKALTTQVLLPQLN